MLLARFLSSSLNKTKKRTPGWFPSFLPGWSMSRLAQASPSRCSCVQACALARLGTVGKERHTLLWKGLRHACANEYIYNMARSFSRASRAGAVCQVQVYCHSQAKYKNVAQDMHYVSSRNETTQLMKLLLRSVPHYAHLLCVSDCSKVRAGSSWWAGVPRSA